MSDASHVPQSKDSCSPAVVLERFDAAHLDAIVECITALWTSENVIARALGVTADEYRPGARRLCERALADGLGLMLREPATDRVVGFFTAVDLVDELELLRARQADAPASDRMARWAALLWSGMQWYLDAYHRDQPLRRGETIYYDIGGTIAEHRGAGWINRMAMEMTTKLVMPRGYRRVVSIATHPHSVHKTRTMSIVGEVHELRFADSPDPDLRRVTEPPCALVGVTKLPSRAADVTVGGGPRAPRSG